MVSDEVDTDTSTDTDEVVLHNGDALTIVESAKITRASETSLVVVAGAPDSGKTSFVASLFHCFQRGPFAGHDFAGSVTCVGLDQRCHRARTRSRGHMPDSERTKVGASKRLLHLCVRKSDGTDQRKHVLFTDISGEEYNDIRHSVDECRRFSLLTRANHLVLLVDGERLTDLGDRHTAKIEAVQFLQCLRDAGRLNGTSRLDVLVTKCDVLDGPATEFASAIQADMQRLIGNSVPCFRFAKVAAHPRKETANYKLGHGVEDLFELWLQRVTTPIDLMRRTSERLDFSEFDRFLVRQFPEVVAES